MKHLVAFLILIMFAGCGTLGGVPELGAYDDTINITIYGRNNDQSHDSVAVEIMKTGTAPLTAAINTLGKAVDPITAAITGVSGAVQAAASALPTYVSGDEEQAFMTMTAPIKEGQPYQVQLIGLSSVINASNGVGDSEEGSSVLSSPGSNIKSVTITVGVDTTIELPPDPE